MPSIIFLFGAVISNVIGQIFLKAGASSIGGLTIHNVGDIIRIFLTPYILLGIGTYGISTIFWIISLSKYDLSFAYPFLSVGYILILIASYFIFKENITVLKVVGVLAIIIGLILISQK